MRPGRLRPFLGRFVRDEGGVISVQNLFIFMAACCASAAAVDVTHMYAAREQLQVAADVAAHSALLTRNRGDASTVTETAAAAARDRAVAAVQWGMPLADFGRVVENADIRFGTWDAATRTFQVDQSDATRSAVLVTAARESATGNAVPTFLFTMAGLGNMNVGATSVYTSFLNDCADDGLMSQTKVDLRSNNAFYRGICLFAPIIQINSGNTFETGTMVQMPDPDKWNTYNQNSTFEQNVGLRDALRRGSFDFYILERLKAAGNLRPGDITLDEAMSTASNELPSYMNRTLVTTPLTVSTSVTPSSFTAGRRHVVTCNGGNGNGNGNNSNSSITFGPGTYSNFVLQTNCILNLSGKVNLENVVLSTTSTDAQSIRTSSGANDGLVIGKDDSCAAGGGAMIFTRGGFKSAAKLEVYGSQILALGEVSFTAGGSTENEFEGVSIIAAGLVSGTSGNDFTGCPAGRNAGIQTLYFAPAW